jgi:TusA-related sulfurtransferase
VLDLRGQTCPTTSHETLRALEAMPSDASLEVVSDYYPARSTIPYHCDKRGYQCAFIEGTPNDAPGVWRLRIHKGENHG